MLVQLRLRLRLLLLLLLVDPLLVRARARMARLAQARPAPPQIAPIGLPIGMAAPLGGRRRGAGRNRMSRRRRGGSLVMRVLSDPVTPLLLLLWLVRGRVHHRHAKLGHARRSGGRVHGEIAGGDDELGRLGIVGIVGLGERVGLGGELVCFRGGGIRARTSTAVIIGRRRSIDQFVLVVT